MKKLIKAEELLPKDPQVTLWTYFDSFSKGEVHLLSPIAANIPLILAQPLNRGPAMLKKLYTSADPFLKEKNAFLKQFLSVDTVKYKFKHSRLNLKLSRSEDRADRNFAFWEGVGCTERTRVDSYRFYHKTGKENKYFIYDNEIKKDINYRELPSRIAFKDTLELNLVGDMYLVLTWSSYLMNVFNFKNVVKDNYSFQNDLINVDSFWDLPALGAYVIKKDHNKLSACPGNKEIYIAKQTLSVIEGTNIFNYDPFIKNLRTKQDLLLQKNYNEYHTLNARLEELQNLILLGNSFGSFLET